MRDVIQSNDLILQQGHVKLFCTVLKALSLGRLNHSMSVIQRSFDSDWNVSRIDAITPDVAEYTLCKTRKLQADTILLEDVHTKVSRRSTAYPRLSSLI